MDGPGLKPCDAPSAALNFIQIDVTPHGRESAATGGDKPCPRTLQPKALSSRLSLFYFHEKCDRPTHRSKKVLKALLLAAFHQKMQVIAGIRKSMDVNKLNPSSFPLRLLDSCWRLTVTHSINFAIARAPFDSAPARRR